MKILYLNGLNEYYNEIIAKHFPQLLNETHPEIILSCGGDGTVLRTFRYMVEHNLNVPFLVLKGGTFNFLPTSFSENFVRLIQQLLNNTYSKLYSFSFNPLKIMYDKKEYLAMNDIIVGNNINDYHKFNIQTESLLLDNLTFSGMGICISSAIGSTGFHLNNGGQVFEDKKSFGITNIVSNIKINDIITSKSLSISLLSDRAKPNIYIDGSNFILPMDKDKTIKISYDSHHYQLMYLEMNELLMRKRDFVNSSRKKTH